MSETDKNLPAPARQPEPSKPAGSGWSLWLLSLLALLAGLAAVAGAAYLWQQQQQLQARLEQLDSGLSRALDQQSSRLDEQGSQIARLTERQDSLAEQNQAQARQIDHTAQALLEAGHRDRTDWLLAEAEYLLRMANQRLTIERDIRGALQILKSADQVLHESDDPGVYPVRQALAREIMALKTLAPVDRTGLYLELEAALGLVETLTEQTLDPHRVGATDQQETPDNTTTPGWERAWTQLLDSLSKAVVIRRLDEPAKPLLSPEQSAYARLNLRLMIEQAQLGLLEGNTSLYQRSLDKARDWLNNWYDTSHAPVRTLNQVFARLSERNIAPDLPDISHSLTLLKARIEGRLGPADPPAGEADREEGS